MGDKGTLGFSEDRYATRIAWFFDGDEGGTLGDEMYTAAQLAKADRDNFEHIFATITASKTEGVQRDSRGYYWESTSDAKNALRAIKAALKAKQAPWPEWAVKAKGEGWTPPKGWKP